MLGGLRVVPLFRTVLAAGIALCAAATGATAGSSWDELKPALFGDRRIEDGQGIVVFKAPYRAEDDRRVPVSATAAFPDGRKVKSVSFIIDENPMPLAAAFRFDEQREKVGLGIDVRLNGPSKVRAVVEASDGRLYMAESLVKTSGLGACAAPPVGDGVAALATLGNMKMAALPPGPDANTRHARLEIKHPQLTGMQMNQITLLYVPARYVSEIALKRGREPLFSAETGFSLSEDPRIDFDYGIHEGNDVLTVRIKDTDGAVFQRGFPLGVGG